MGPLALNLAISSPSASDLKNGKHGPTSAPTSFEGQWLNLGLWVEWIESIEFGQVGEHRLLAEVEALLGASLIDSVFFSPLRGSGVYFEPLESVRRFFGT